ncbi:MAG: ThiF family adenylyltransferase [Planctomycetota bacterium]
MVERDGLLDGADELDLTVRGRYGRQVLLPGIGEAGQARLAASRVLVLGCGALGSVLAETLVRAGVGLRSAGGCVRVVDRDVLEWSNLQRQVLYTEADVRDGLPKAEAARRRLGEINGETALEAEVADMSAGTIERLLGVRGGVAGVDLMVDGLDNVETRWLVNEAAVFYGVPYVYGGAVGTAGMVYPVLPRSLTGDRAWEREGGGGATPDLEQVFGGGGGSGGSGGAGGGGWETCDTVGVLGPLIHVVAGLQAAEALKVLAGRWEAVTRKLQCVELWGAKGGGGGWRALEVGEARAFDMERPFPLLEGKGGSSAVTLCGRGAVQLSPTSGGSELDVEALAGRWSVVLGADAVRVNAFLVKGDLRGSGVAEGRAESVTAFRDGRVLVQGTTDTAVARGVYDRLVGG